MPIHRLNHAVLYVRDAERSAEFYGQVLGFRQVMRMPRSGPARALFLQAEGSTNDHDLGLFTIGPEAAPSDAGRRTVGLYHLAWEVDTLDDLERVAATLAERGSLVGASDHGSTKAVYARDPDGIELEVSWLVPAELLDGAVARAESSIKPLDIAREKTRYGGSRLGGVGISRPARPASEAAV